MYVCISERSEGERASDKQGEREEMREYLKVNWKFI